MPHRRGGPGFKGLALELEGGVKVSALGGDLAIRGEDCGVRLGGVFPVHEVRQGGAGFTEVPPASRGGTVVKDAGVVKLPRSVHPYPGSMPESLVVCDIVVHPKRARRPSVVRLQGAIDWGGLRRLACGLCPEPARTQHIQGRRREDKGEPVAHHGTKMRLVVDEALCFGYFCSPKPFYS